MDAVAEMAAKPGQLGDDTEGKLCLNLQIACLSSKHAMESASRYARMLVLLHHCLMRNHYTYSMIE